MLQEAKLRDRTAPRFRKTKYRYKALNKNLFDSYLELFPEGIKEFSTFKNVIEDFNSLVADRVVSNRDGVKLPALMGIMALCSFKPKNKVPLHWKYIDQTGKKIKEMNIATNGLACKIVYSLYTSKYQYQHSHIWRFEGCRQFKNKASSGFRENYNIYKRMDNKSKVSKMFKDDYIGINFFIKRDEQGVELRREDNGPLHLQRSVERQESSFETGGGESQTLPPIDLIQDSEQS